MAQELGQAQLTLTVNLDKFREDLRSAKQLVNSELGGAASTGSQTRTRQSTSRARSNAPSAESVNRRPIQGSVRDTGSPVSSARGARNGGANDSILAREKAAERIIGIQNRINVLEAQGADVTESRVRLAQAIAAQEQGNFGTVRQVTLQLANALKIEEGRLRVATLRAAQLKREQQATQKPAEVPSSSRSGLGFATTPEQILASRGGTQKGAAIGIDERNKLLDKYISLEARGNVLAAKGVNVEKQVALAKRITAAFADEQYGTVKQLNAELARQLKIEENNLRIQSVKEAVARKAAAAEKKQQATTAAPRTPPAPRPQSATPAPSQAAAVKAEADLQKARAKTAAETLKAAQRENTRQKALAASNRKQRNDRIGGAIGSGLIGGGFPLLFGQGAGAAAGGAIGGIGGGAIGGQFGFALSVVGTAIGQAFDTALQKGRDLAKGLDDPIGNFQLLSDAALFSSKAVERNVASLIAAGREEEAAIAARRDLSQRFGGAENARALTEATDELNRAWTEATVSLTAFVAGPLADFLKSLAVGLGGSPEQARAKQDNARAMELVNSDPQLRKQFVDLAKQRGVSLDSNLQVGAGDLGKRVELVKEFLRLQGELTGAQREQQQLDAASVDAAKRRKDIEALTLGIIQDQASGNRTGELEKTRRLLPLQQTKELNLLPTNATEVDREAVRTKFAKELLKIDGERLQLQRDLNRTVEEESAKRAQIAQDLRTVRARRDAALATADSAANPGNSTLAARAGQLEGASFLEQNRLKVEQAITAERLLQAQYAQESDPTKRAQLAEQLTSAAYEIKLAGEEAGAALAERAASAAQSLRSAQESLRGTLQSNFRLLPRAQRQSLLESARADIERGRQAGILRPDFGAAGRRRTFEAADFVRNVEQQQAQVAQQQALVDALKENTNAERNIRINVTMNADGTFSFDQTEQQAALL